jgi:transposase
MSVGGLGLERDGKVGVHLGGSMGIGVSRLELTEGPSGRRRRMKVDRARIAA